MNTKHTPGPWSVCNDGHETQSTFLIGTNENPDVARIYDITKEAPANAKLIAAAPELLAALQMAYADLVKAANERGQTNDFTTSAEAKVIRAAIEKAIK